MTSTLAQLWRLRLCYDNRKFLRKYIYQNSKIWLSTSSINLLNYSHEDKRKILDEINQSDNELIRYNISKNRIKKIESWKSKYGQFESLEQILEIEGFENKILDKFCKSILNGGDDTKLEKSLKRHHGNFCIPNISAENRLSYKSCISLHIGISSVTWTKLHLNSLQEQIEVEEWRHCDIVDKKLQLQDLIRKCLEIDALIPNADCYVLENQQTIQTSQLPGNTEQIRTNVQKAQLFAILSFGFMKRIFGNDNLQYLEKPNLFYLRRFLASRLFKLFVGTEKVSSEQVVLDLMRVHYNIEDKLNDENATKYESSTGEFRVIFPSEIRKIYESSEGHEREYLGQSLLIGLTFMRLCLLKCPSSLNAVGGGNTKTK